MISAQKYLALFILAAFFCGCESSKYTVLPKGSKSVTAYGSHKTVAVPVESPTTSTHPGEVEEEDSEPVGPVIRDGEIVVSTKDIHEAARENNAQDIHGFFQLGFNVNETEKGLLKTQNTALHLTARHNNVEAAKALIEVGADVNIRSLYGKTALHLAADKNNVEVAEVLLSAEGMEINAIDNIGETALLTAARRGHFEMVEVLVKWGVDVSVTNRDEKTAREVAKRLFYRRIARLLKEREEEIAVEVSEAMGRVEQNGMDEDRMKKLKALAPL